MLSTAIGMALLPSAWASITVNASPNAGSIDFFPAIPDYTNFSSDLTVMGIVSGTPTWNASPAPGSPSCATYIQVSFGDPHAWNTTATFDDHSAFSCQATMNLNVTSSGPSGSTHVHVNYFICRHCT